MSPKKLTNDDKQEILNLYRQTPETTSTLADRYGVSSSTISRFLKNTLSDVEYEDLIQQKRLARTSKLQVESPMSDPVLSEESKPVPKIRQQDLFTASDTVETFEDTLPKPTPSKEKPTLKKASPVLVSQQEDEDEDAEELEDINVVAVGEMLGEDLEDSDEDWDNEDEDEDEDEDEYDDSLSTQQDIQVLPLSAATFPKTCYLVIDRAAELIARPLKEFAHLGQIPVDEVQQKTLPIFDNHRVARRFSNRSQRVIKIPDGRLLYKTCSYLQAKGITRILMDGQIYSLVSHSEQ
ncbi:MAG: transposase [Crocosphaera sp.]|nr:transposase [Crocosphaera sp.]